MSFIQVITLGLKGLLFTEFGEYLDLPNINRGVIFVPKDVALRDFAEKKGTMGLGFINFWNIRTSYDWKRQRTPLARRGLKLEYKDSEKSGIIRAKTVPVLLDYDVWFWADSIEKIFKISEHYLFWRQTDPNLNLLYNDLYPLELDLHFGDLTDESTVAEKFTKGTYFVLRVPITVDGWVFVSDEVGVVHKIVLTCYDKNSLGEADYTEIMVEDSNHDVELEATLRLFRKEIV